jgi:hypothetical protein
MRESWIHIAGVVVLLLCALLLVVPLYFVVVIHGQSYWSTLFDMPADLLFARPSRSALAYLSRVVTFVLVAGTVGACAFRRFAFRWVPPLLFALLAAMFPVRWLYPNLGNPPGVVHPLGFGLLVAFVFCCAFVAALQVLASFSGKRGIQVEAID